MANMLYVSIALVKACGKMWLNMTWGEMTLCNLPLAKCSQSFHDRIGYVLYFFTGFIRSWKLIEFENAFSRRGKIMGFRKNGQVMEKPWKFISCRLKTGNIKFDIEQKHFLKRLGFQHLVVMENLENWKSHWKVTGFYCPISVRTVFQKFKLIFYQYKFFFKRKCFNPPKRPLINLVDQFFT